MLELFTASFGPAVALQIAFAGMIAGREPVEEDMEPLSWAIWSLCKGIDSVQALAAEAQLHGFARAPGRRWTAQYDVVLTPALAEAPVLLGTMDPQSADPMADFARSGRVHALHGDAERQRVAGDQPAALHPADDDEAAASRSASSSSASPPARAPLLALAAQLEAAHSWAGAAGSARRLSAASRAAGSVRTSGAARARDPRRCGSR